MTKRIAEQVPGYTYGTDAVAPSPITLQELEALKVTVGFTEEDQRYLLLAGEVLTGQTREIVLHWRSGIIAGIPNLARHSRSLEGNRCLTTSPRAIFVLSSGSRHLLPPLRSRLAQLSTGDCAAAYKFEEK